MIIQQILKIKVEIVDFMFMTNKVIDFIEEVMVH